MSTNQQATHVRVHNNVPRVVGLAGQKLLLKPGEVAIVLQETWRKVLEHPLTPKLLRGGMVTVMRADEEPNR